MSEVKIKGDKIKEGSIPLSALSPEVKDKIENAGGGADWNAQEHEAGYIKNKPFYTKGDTRQIDVNGEYTITVGEFNIGDKVDVRWDLEYYSGEVFRGSASFVIQEGHIIYYQENDFYIIGGKTFEMYAYNGSDSLYGKVSVIVNGEIKTLEDKYLPNTVLKTTPQEISDTDKNQALANLGIADLLEALKPVQLSRLPPTGNVTQEQLDEIGLTEKVINNILNGYTNKILTNNLLFHVIYAYSVRNTSEFIFVSFNFGGDGIIESCTQYKYIKDRDKLTIEIMEI